MTDTSETAELEADQFRRPNLLRLAVDALERGDKYFRVILNALPAAVYVTDAAGLITYYNEAAAALWGCRPELGKSQWCGSWKLYWPDGTPLPHEECPMALALREGQPNFGMEAIAERPDGSRVPFIPYPTPLYDAAKKLVGAVNMLVDISDRKRAEEQARQLASIVECSDDAVYSRVLSADDAIVRKNFNGAITNWNRGAERLFGYTANEAIGMPLSILIPPDREDEELCILNRLLRGEQVDHFETVRRRKDGSLVDISLTVSPIRNAEGRIVGASKIARDVTERRRAEVQARRLASIVECSHDAIVGKDTDGVITSWNPGAEQLFGYSAAEAIGKPVSILIPPDRQNEEPGILQRIRRGERIDHYETVRRRKDGELIDIALTVSPIKNASGEIIGASKIARDISERRRAEQKQNLLLREMDHRVKNLFALCNGVVSLSARYAKTPEELASVVGERLGALARAHALTLPKVGEGGEYSTTLHALIQTIVSPYDDHTDNMRRTRVVVRGPDVPIVGGTVTSVALLVHEFATNAAKYGALSTPEGFIDIECSEEGERFVLTWWERNGPRVDQIQGEGFGTLLGRATVKGQLGGEISREWQPEGLTIRLSVIRERLVR